MKKKILFLLLIAITAITSCSREIKDESSLDGTWDSWIINAFIPSAPDGTICWKDVVGEEEDVLGQNINHLAQNINTITKIESSTMEIAPFQVGNVKYQNTKLVFSIDNSSPNNLIIERHTSNITDLPWHIEKKDENTYYLYTFYERPWRVVYVFELRKMKNNIQ